MPTIRRSTRQYKPSIWYSPSEYVLNHAEVTEANQAIIVPKLYRDIADDPHAGWYATHQKEVDDLQNTVKMEAAQR